MKPPETAHAEFGFASEGTSPTAKAVSSETADRLSEAMEAPEAAPPLPDGRTIEDLPVGSSVLVWLPADRDGTFRELIPGRVDSADPGGWLRVALDWAPGGCIVEADSVTVIPLEALPHLSQDEAYLEAWTATDDDPPRRTWELRYALRPWLKTEEIRVRMPRRATNGTVGRREKAEVTAEEIIDRLGLGHLLSDAPEAVGQAPAEPGTAEPPTRSEPFFSEYEPSAGELRRDRATLREEELSLSCQAAWDNLHRKLAEGGNSYLE